MAELILLWIL